MNRFQSLSCCLGFLLVLSLTSCAGLNPQSIKREKPYSSMLGKQFKLLVNCYVVDIPDTDINIVSPDNAKYYGLPMPVNQNNVGKSFRDGKIIAIIPKDSVFKITDIVRKKSFEYDIIMYYVSFDFPQFKKLNGYRIFSRDGNVPSILPKFAKELKKQQP